MPNGLHLIGIAENLGGVHIFCVVHEIHTPEAFLIQPCQGIPQIGNLLFDNFRAHEPLRPRLITSQANLDRQVKNNRCGGGRILGCQGEKTFACAHLDICGIDDGEPSTP